MAFELMNAISRCQLHMKLDNITQGDGNCFPRAVVQQCRRPELELYLNNDKINGTQTFMSVRNAVCDFMMYNEHPSVTAFKQSCNENEYQMSRVSWSDYWHAMRQHKVWVDYKFIQGTAWYLNNDIMLVTTGSTPENPYIFISGNIEDKNIPSPGVPMLIGSQLDLHFKSCARIKQISQFSSK